MSNKQTDEQGKPLSYWGGLNNNHIVDANKKVSSIEHLVNWMSKNEYFIGNDLLKEIEKAKEMHKQEIKDAYRFGLGDEYVIGSFNYYNQTFGK